ncbi:MAG TPA: hypothetical protein VG917_04480 [Patescibacteria group bacterium]|nr:hypothetical protein [Patescibacteria group bacterium]
MTTEGVPIPQDPQFLNHQLLGLYDLLPRRDMRFKRVEPSSLEKAFGLPAMEVSDVPRTSELKDRIMVGVRGLLPQAHITPSFREELIEIFEGLCDAGAWKEIEFNPRETRFLVGPLADEMKKDFVYDIVVVNSQDGAGIFDPKDAKVIEKLAYSRKYRGSLQNIRVMERFIQNLNREGGNNKDYVPDPNSPSAARLQKWRQEFMEKYHEEP